MMTISDLIHPIRNAALENPNIGDYRLRLIPVEGPRRDVFEVVVDHETSELMILAEDDDLDLDDVEELEVLDDGGRELL